MDYYAILGVHPTAEDVVIRAAYKALAQRYHPDRFAGAQDEAHQRMSEITKAYEVLADPARRIKYDRRRLTYTQSVANYFSAGPRDSPLIIDPRSLRSVATLRRRSRLALSALLAAVVVLSAFNVVQYSAQIGEWFGARASAPADAKPRDRAEAPPAAVAAAASVAAPGAHAVAGRNLPVSPPAAPPSAASGAITATGATAATATTATTGATAMVAVTAAPAAAAKAPDSTRTGEAASTPIGALALESPARPPAPRQETPASAPRAIAAGGVPPAAASLPTAPAAPAPTPAACTETIAALGLCTPQTTARTR